MVGDYVNRGPNSAGVLELLHREKQKRGDDLVLLWGNHESALLRFIESGDFVPFAAHGGMATIRSYVPRPYGDVHAQLARSIPYSHQDLLRNELELCFETEDLLVSHTGFDPETPSARTWEALVGNSHPELFATGGVVGRPRPLVICGHYVQQSGRPFVSEGLVCIDTGCGTLNGPLTAVLLPDREFVAI